MLIEVASSRAHRARTVLPRRRGHRRPTGELIALRWSSIDIRNLQVLIDRAVVQVGQQVIEKDTKTHQARRLAIDTGTAALLEDHRVEVERRAQLARVELDDRSFVFSDDPDGSRPWKPDRVTTAFGRFCQQAGVTGVRFHDLRHFATRLLSSAVDVRAVSGRLGHATASTTLGVYAHFSCSQRTKPRPTCSATCSADPNRTSWPERSGWAATVARSARNSGSARVAP